jgi:arylsulfatase A-like enzyme
VVLFKISSLIIYYIKFTRDRNPPLAHLTLNGNAWVVENTVTVAHAFQAAGFKTAMTGKWHLSSTVETETKGGFTYQVKDEHDQLCSYTIPHLSFNAHNMETFPSFFCYAFKSC